MHANLQHNKKRPIPITVSPKPLKKILMKFGTQLSFGRLLRNDFEYVSQARNPTVISPTPFDGLTMHFVTYPPLRGVRPQLEKELKN